MCQLFFACLAAFSFLAYNYCQILQNFLFITIISKLFLILPTHKPSILGTLRLFSSFCLKCLLFASNISCSFALKTNNITLTFIVLTYYVFYVYVCILTNEYKFLHMYVIIWFQFRANDYDLRTKWFRSLQRRLIMSVCYDFLCKL